MIIFYNNKLDNSNYWSYETGIMIYYFSPAVFE